LAFDLRVFFIFSTRAGLLSRRRDLLYLFLFGAVSLELEAVMFRGLLSGEILLKSNFPVGEVTLKTSSFSKSHSDKLSVLDIDDCDENGYIVQGLLMLLPAGDDEKLESNSDFIVRLM
jgi:hypothetical protein